MSRQLESLERLASCGLLVCEDTPGQRYEDATRDAAVSLLKAVSAALAREEPWSDEHWEARRSIELEFTRYDGARAVAAVATLLESSRDLIDYVRRERGHAEQAEVSR